ncbi:MAG: hypothetical protein GY842_28140 [bacterium]|nr:hypothetical protein [bacterium]
MRDAIIEAMAGVFERSEDDVRSTVGEREGCILTISTETGVIPDPWSGFADDYERWMEVQRRLETTAHPGVTPCYWDSINPGLQCWYP